MERILKMYPLLDKNVQLHFRSDEVFIFSEASLYYRLNLTGGEILELCTGNRTVNDICTIMAVRYHSSLSKVKALVLPFIKKASEKRHIALNRYPTSRKVHVTGNKNAWIPYYVSIEITKKCPLRCAHCFAEAGTPMSNELPITMLMQIIKNFGKAGTASVYITGGEPLSHPHFIEILYCCASVFRQVEIATSGYNLNEKIAQKIAALENVIVQVSLDGEKEMHNYIRGRDDAFDNAVKAISTLSNKGVLVTVAMTVNSLNMDQLERVIKIAKMRGAKRFRVGNTLSQGRARNLDWGLKGNQLKVFTSYLHQVTEKHSSDNFFISDWASNVEPELIGMEGERVNCGAGHLLYNVTPEGEVTPCIPINIILGNLTTSTFEEVFGSQKVNFFRNLRAPNANICSECKEFNFCQGCQAAAYLNYNSVADCKWYRQLKNFPNE